MGKKIQQQIVGGIFIVAVLLLFVPYFLSSPSPEQPRPEATNIPNDDTTKPNDIHMVVSVNQEPNDNLVQTDETPDPIPESAWNLATLSDQSNTTAPNVNALNNDPLLNVQPHEALPPEPTSIASTILEKNQTQETNSNDITTPAKQQVLPQNNKLPDLALSLPTLKLEGTAASNYQKPQSPVKTIQPTQQSNTNNYRWFIQVGVFDNINNANKLANEYRAKSYSVYIDQTTKQHKVRLGPYKTKQNAQKAQAHLKGSKIDSTLVQLP